MPPKSIFTPPCVPVLLWPLYCWISLFTRRTKWTCRSACSYLAADKKSQQITSRYIHSIFLPASFVHPYHYFLFLKKSINSTLLHSILIMQQPSITSSACPWSARDRSTGVVIALRMSITLQGWAKVRFPGSVKMRWKQKTQLFLLIFMEPGNCTLAHPCIENKPGK